MKIQKLMCSHQVRNSPTNSSETRQLISKSWSITCSVWGDYQHFQTLSGSKYCRGRWLTLTLSSQQSTWLSLTTKQLRCSGTLNFNLDIWNQSKQSGTMGTGLIVYSVFQCMMWFIYPHRESELIQYSEYITIYFVSANAGGQNQVLNLDKAIQCWSGSVNNVLFDQFKKCRFLKVCHVFSKAAGDQSMHGSQWGLTAGQHGGASAWQSKDLCWLFNQRKCGKQASECQYRHVCIRCGKEEHAKKECTSKKAWVISCEGQETEARQEISMES